MRTAIYIRVSTQEQAIEGYSIDAQKECLINYCKAKGWALTEMYIDPGCSGSNLNRPQIQKLLENAGKGVFDVVLVYKLDRLSRSQKDTLYLIEDVFLKNNIAFVSLKENFDTSSAFGRAMIGILSVFAQLEREQIKERTRMGLEERIKQGHHHSYAPFGYQYINKTLTIVEKEAKIVKEIFELASQNMSFKQIMDIILQNHPDCLGLSSGPQKVRGILSNSTYAGYVRFGNVESKGQHEAIIDEATFSKVNQILDKKHTQWEKYRTKRTGIYSAYLLTGFLFCGECGARYRSIPKRGKTEKSVAEYKCYSRFGNPPHMVKKKNCKSPIFKMNILHNLVFTELKKIKDDENYFNKLKAIPDNSIKDVIQRNEKELAKIEIQMNKLLDLYQYDNIDIEVFTPRINSLSEKKKTIQETINNLQKSNAPTMSYHEVKTMLSSVDKLIEEGATDKLRQLLQILLEKIIISNDGVKFFWNFS